MSSEYITANEIANRLDVARSTVANQTVGVNYRSRKAGTLLPFLAEKGRETVYRVCDVEDWLEGDGLRYRNKWYGLTGSVEQIEEDYLRDIWTELSASIRPWKWDVAIQESPDGWASSCWVWSGARTVRCGSLNTTPALIAYTTAYPDLDGPVISACGSKGCINPDHLTNEAWGLKEDFKFLALGEDSPVRIEELFGGQDAASDAATGWLGSDDADLERAIHTYRFHSYALSSHDLRDSNPQLSWAFDVRAAETQHHLRRDVVRVAA